VIVSEVPAKFKERIGKIKPQNNLAEDSIILGLMYILQGS
jgi:hypothetical protein